MVWLPGGRPFAAHCRPTHAALTSGFHEPLYKLSTFGAGRGAHSSVTSIQRPCRPAAAAVAEPEPLRELQTVEPLHTDHSSRRTALHSDEALRRPLFGSGGHWQPSSTTTSGGPGKQNDGNVCDDANTVGNQFRAIAVSSAESTHVHGSEDDVGNSLCYAEDFVVAINETEDHRERYGWQADVLQSRNGIQRHHTVPACQEPCCTSVSEDASLQRWCRFPVRVSLAPLFHLLGSKPQDFQKQRGGGSSKTSSSDISSNDDFLDIRRNSSSSCSSSSSSDGDGNSRSSRRSSRALRDRHGSVSSPGLGAGSSSSPGLGTSSSSSSSTGGDQETGHTGAGMDQGLDSQLTKAGSLWSMAGLSFQQPRNSAAKAQDELLMAGGVEGWQELQLSEGFQALTVTDATLLAPAVHWLRQSMGCRGSDGSSSGSGISNSSSGSSCTGDSSCGSNNSADSDGDASTVPPSSSMVIKEGPAGDGLLAIDMEWRPNFVKGQKPQHLALLQLATSTRCLLIHFARMRGAPPSDAQLASLLALLTADESVDGVATMGWNADEERLLLKALRLSPSDGEDGDGQARTSDSGSSSNTGDGSSEAHTLDGMGASSGPRTAASHDASHTSGGSKPGSSCDSRVSSGGGGGSAVPDAMQARALHDEKNHADQPCTSREAAAWKLQQRLIDVQRVAAAAGFPRVNVASLVQQVLGAKDFAKSGHVSMSNWDQELTPAMIHYAVLDGFLPGLLLRQLRFLHAAPYRCPSCLQPLFGPELPTTIACQHPGCRSKSFIAMEPYLRHAQYMQHLPAYTWASELCTCCERTFYRRGQPVAAQDMPAPEPPRLKATGLKKGVKEQKAAARRQAAAQL